MLSATGSIAPWSGQRQSAPLLAVLACGLVIVSTPAPARDQPLRSSPLVELAETVRIAPHQQQVLFAQIALNELIAEYELALNESGYDDARAPERSRRSSQWCIATETYLGQLRQFARALEHGSLVEIHVDRQRQVHLFIGSQAVTLDSPYLNRSVRLGDRIQQSYCLVEYCAVAGAVGAEGLPYGVWSFGDAQGAVLSTTAGIQCAFLDVRDKDHKERLCRQLAGELQTLVEALYGHQRGGHLIEWQHLAVRKTGLVVRERVMLDGRGQSLPLDLPTLGRFGTLPQSVRDWLRRRVEGGRPELELSQADADFARLLEN